LDHEQPCTSFSFALRATESQAFAEYTTGNQQTLELGCRGKCFLGSDFQDIQRYKEFEISPQGDWIDLDIDLHKPHHEEGWTWNSGFEVLARIDPKTHIWYGAMRITVDESN